MYVIFSIKVVLMKRNYDYTITENKFVCLLFPGQYYPEDEEDEGPGISAVVGEHVTNMTVAMSAAVTTKTMLDVESKVGMTVIL